MRLEVGMDLVVAYLVFDEVGDGVDPPEPIGTVFFVGGSLPDAAGTVYYAVTARHLIEDCRASTGKTYIRVNRIAGGYVDLPTEPNDWTRHPTTDVAAIRFLKTADLQMDGFRSDLMIHEANATPFPRVGDPVTFISLFTQSPGRRNNEVVARFGRISRLMWETVAVEIVQGHPRVEVDAYLVEALSWGGHSGAPALYYIPDNIPGKGASGQERGPWLLGLVHGHAKAHARVRDSARPDSYATVDLNAGMAVVLPAVNIVETLDMPALRDERQQLIDAARQRRGTIEKD